MLLDSLQRCIGVITAAKAYQWIRFMQTYLPRCLKGEEIEGYFAFIYKVPFICLKVHTNYVTFLFEKRFLRKECKEHSIVCITAFVIIDKIVLVVHWCY